ncbi:CobW family GTP-binding protein [Mesorhizobium sp. 10J20-29]
MNFLRSHPFGRIQKSPGAARIPVTILTGFLGAGKSTLLKRFLASPVGMGTAVIVNEFGEIGIDDTILRTATDNIRLIEGGCLCCASSSDLARALRELFAERAKGTIPPFCQVVLETSGMVDPSPILMTLANDRALADVYALTDIVTVVDAVSAPSSCRELPEWGKQVALADQIVLSKTDLATDRDQRALMETLSAINPSANIVISREDAHLVLGARIRSVIGTSPFRSVEVSNADQLHNYTSFSVRREKPVPWMRFRRFVDVIAECRGDDFLRMKGLVNVEGRVGPVIVHQVQHLTHAPEELERWPSADRSTRLIFITKNIDGPTVEALFASILDL